MGTGPVPQAAMTRGGQRREQIAWRRLARAMLRRRRRKQADDRFRQQHQASQTIATGIVSVVTVVHLVIDADEEPFVTTVPVATTLSYTSADPWAVQVSFHPGGEEEPIAWTFDRSLLRDGLDGKSGEGDVCIWRADKLNLGITLSGVDLRALLHAPADAVSAFLAATHALVPVGTEPAYASTEAELDSLLEEP